MTADGVDFDMANLAAAMEHLTAAEIDTLPFGVIAIDRFGAVLVYSRTERKQSGYEGTDPVGQDFFNISCFGGAGFRGHIEAARQQGKVDLEIGWFGDFADPGRALRIRVQSGKADKLWLFVQRDPEDDVSRGPGGRRSEPGRRCSKTDG